MSFQAEIRTMEGVRWQGNVSSLKAPAADGYFGVLTGHAPTIVQLGAGTVALECADGPDIFFAVDGGVAEINRDHILLLAEWLSPRCSLAEAARYCLQRAARKSLS